MQINCHYHLQLIPSTPMKLYVHVVKYGQLNQEAGQTTGESQREQPRIAVIFQGQGRKIAEGKPQAWHDDINVQFQQNAWADTQFSAAWAEKTLKQVAEKESKFALFCDNLTTQKSDHFKTVVSYFGGFVWFGVPNATDLWKPVDGGFAEQLKTDENADK